MEYILPVLILFILIGVLLKAGSWPFPQVCLLGVGCAVFIILTCQSATLQSKTQLAALLANSLIMRDVAVLITVESLLGFAFCIDELRSASCGKRWWRPILRCYPGLMLFPVLFYLQTQLIFAMPGIGFRTLSYIFAAAVAFALPLLVSLLKFILTDKELRLETYFITNLFICLLGLIATVNGNIAYSAVNTHVEIKGVLLSAGIFLIFFAMGFLINKYKYKMGIRYK